MNYQRVGDATAIVQEKAEYVHCASAIFAIEEILSDSVKREKNAVLRYLAKQMADAVEAGDDKAAESLRTEIAKLNKDYDLKIKRTRIRIRYSDGVNYTAQKAEDVDSVARTVEDRDVRCIVLPQALQDTIVYGLRSAGEKWDDTMRAAKDKLRWLTGHEIGHLVLDAVYTSEAPATEQDAINFTDILARLRKERAKSLYKGA